MLLKRKKKAGDRGFSFIELVIVVAVVGILTAIAIPSYGAIQNSAKQAAVDSNANIGYRAVAASEAGFGVTTAGYQAREAATPPAGSAAAVLAKLSTPGEIELRLIDKADTELTSVSGDYCVWAYDAREKLGNKWRYNGLVGDCPAVAPDRADVVTPEPTDPPVEPTPEPTEPVEEPYTPVSSFSLKCPANVQGVSNPFNGVKGTITLKQGDTVVNETVYETAQAVPATLTLTANVDYTLTLEGTFDRFHPRAINEAGLSCFRSMDQWDPKAGTVTAAQAFAYMPNFTSVPDELPSTVKSLYSTFLSAGVFNDSSVTHWDISNVEILNYTFSAARFFNQDISNWNTSNVTTIVGMFRNSTRFSQDLSQWDVSKVTTSSTRASFSNGSALTAAQLPKWPVA